MGILKSIRKKKKAQEKIISDTVKNIEEVTELADEIAALLQDIRRELDSGS